MSINLKTIFKNMFYSFFSVHEKIIPIYIVSYNNTNGTIFFFKQYTIYFMYYVVQLNKPSFNQDYLSIKLTDSL